MRISDWSSDVCSSDLAPAIPPRAPCTASSGDSLPHAPLRTAHRTRNCLPRPARRAAPPHPASSCRRHYPTLHLSSSIKFSSFPLLLHSISVALLVLTFFVHTFCVLLSPFHLKQKSQI